MGRKCAAPISILLPMPATAGSQRGTQQGRYGVLPGIGTGRAAQMGDGGDGLVADVVHAPEHGREHGQPHHDHHALQIDRITDVGGIAGHGPGV